MADLVSNLGGLILKIVVFLAIWGVSMWLLEEGYLKYALIAAVLVGLFLWKTGRWDPPFLPETAEVSSHQAVPQETRSQDDTKYRPYWNQGVCRTLSEDVHVVVVFLEDSESVWYDYTHNWLLRNKLEPGMELIRKQSKNYGYSLDMNYTEYQDVKIDISVPQFYESHDAHDAIAPAVAGALGFSSPEEMLEYHREYYGKDQIAYFFCVNKHGRSYACPRWGDDLEYCVFFTLYDNGWATGHDAVPHEILHLFGALDMYDEGTERVNRAKLARQLCPDDVMLCNNRRAPIVDRFTAYSIGWLDSMPSEYNRDEWWS